RGLAAWPARPLDRARDLGVVVGARQGEVPARGPARAEIALGGRRRVDLGADRGEQRTVTREGRVERGAVDVAEIAFGDDELEAAGAEPDEGVAPAIDDLAGRAVALEEVPGDAARDQLRAHEQRGDRLPGGGLGEGAPA